MIDAQRVVFRIAPDDFSFERIDLLAGGVERFLLRRRTGECQRGDENDD